MFPSVFFRHYLIEKEHFKMDRPKLNISEDEKIQVERTKKKGKFESGFKGKKI